MKTTFKLLSIALVSVFSINAAVAQNIHYIDGPVTTDNGTTLTVCGKIAGLGNNQGVDIKITTTATISTECTNPGGNVAPGQSRTETISATKKFWSDKNGNISFCVNTLEQAPGICPNGKWTGRVTDVLFINTVVTVDGKVIN
jgi:hypothetical protein